VSNTDFGCCGGQPSGEQACECIKQDLAHRVIPTGSHKLAGQEREYSTTTNLWLTRQAFKAWSKNEGREVDPISGLLRWDMGQFLKT